MKKVFSIIGTISGCISIIFSFVVFSFDVGSTEMSNTYGGDAYTGIQNAAAQTANNTFYIAEISRYGVFAILFVIGMIAICYFAPRIVENDTTKAMLSDAIAEAQLSEAETEESSTKEYSYYGKTSDENDDLPDL